MIEINNLAFRYSFKDQLFTNVNMTLNKGGICGLLGKNGSGKTTLLKMITGLIFPQKGQCQVLGQTPQERAPSFLQEIYFLPEELSVPPLTADTYVKLYSVFYPKFNHANFNSYMKEFDLPTNKLLTHFSYGQKKKFLIAFGLATECQLIILDEPTNGLDIPSKAQFRKLLASAATDEKLFIISTHQVHDVENLIDSIVLLDEGKIVFHQSLYDITKKLAFVLMPTEPDPTICFYSEKHLGGYSAVVVNQDEHDTQIDLEVLFNAVLLNKEKMQQLFLGDK